MTLRSALTRLVLAVVAIALSAAVALVAITALLHRTTARLGQAMENAQLAERSLVDLWAIDASLTQHAQDASPEAWDAVHERAAALLERIASMRERELAPEGRSAIDTATRAIDRYVEAATPSGVPTTGPVDSSVRTAFDEAREALHRFADVSQDRARSQRDTAAWWDHVADLWGLGAAALLIAGTGTVLVLLRSRLFEPLMGMGDSIARYGRGERTQRVPEGGPHELRTIARHFNEMADRLERRREDQLAFLAGLAHDLRTPLSAMRIASERLRRDIAAPERAGGKIAVLERQIGRLDRLASNFLDAARAEAGQLELVLDEHDLRDIARGAVELFSESSRAHVIDLVTPDRPVGVRCDVSRVEEIVNNLIANAIKYSPDGGPIRIEVRCDARDAVFTVADRGVGIPADELATIFEPFRRGTRLTGAVPGIGLGLTTSRRIAERHGGTLTVSSTSGVGSTFELRLPVSRRAAAERASRDVSSADRGIQRQAR